MVFPSDQEALAAIREIVTNFLEETLQTLPGHCIERLKSLSQNNGNHYP
jgi:hypothetical protein